MPLGDSKEDEIVIGAQLDIALIVFKTSLSSIQLREGLVNSVESGIGKLDVVPGNNLN